jgi:hypothetical protein
MKQIAAGNDIEGWPFLVYIFVSIHGRNDASGNELA